MKEKIKSPTKSAMGKAILVLKSALIKTYTLEDHISDAGYKTIEDAINLANDILEESAR